MITAAFALRTSSKGHPSCSVVEPLQSPPILVSRAHLQSLNAASLVLKPPMGAPFALLRKKYAANQMVQLSRDVCLARRLSNQSSKSFNAVNPLLNRPTFAVNAPFRNSSVVSQALRALRVAGVALRKWFLQNRFSVARQVLQAVKVANFALL